MNRGDRRDLIVRDAEDRYGEELWESAEAKVEGLIDRELGRKGRKGEDLRRSRKGDRFKVWLAGLLRAQTTMTIGWIAERLQLGTRGYVTHLPYWDRRGKGVKPRTCDGER